MLEILTLPVLADNYIFVIHDKVSHETAVVDPARAQPVLDCLNQNCWHLDYIFNTHHHWDHVGGNLELKQKTGCKVIAGSYDKNRIPGLDQTVDEGNTVNLGKHQARIFFTPGHTLGHIVYYFAEDNLLFCGDTLFVMGCGRLFEGTAQQLWNSLQKLKQLPLATQVYCTHEYTQNNGKFALNLDPENADLRQKIQEVNKKRSRNLPTVPSTIEDELATNPFFREDSREIQQNIGLICSRPAEIFAKIRQLKDSF